MKSMKKQSRSAVPKVAAQRQPTRPRTSKPRPNTQGIMAAYAPANGFQSRFARHSRNGCETLIGTDLLGLLSGPAVASHAATSYRVPVNPLFWQNTRISNEIRTFNTYRPKSIVLHWQPNVGSTTNGAVIMGTASVTSSISGAAIATSLLASNGGKVNSVWREISCTIDLTGLTQRAYNVNGVDEDAIPVVGYVIVPPALADAGYLWASYEFECFMPCAVPAELCYYRMDPTTLTLTNASVQFPLGSSTGINVGDEFDMVANGNAIGTYLTYYTGGMLNAVADFGRVGSTHISNWDGANAHVYENDQTFGKDGLIVSVYYQKMLGSI